MVEYRYAVLEAIRARAVDGLTSPGGGVAVGGLLYGERHVDVVRILAFQPLEIEHASGPGFVLSENDEARFRELMKPRDGMRAVGWYGSHMRTGVGLGANDCSILERFCPERGSVALLLKPMAEGPAEATFHVQGYAEPGPRFSILPSRIPESPSPLDSAPVLNPAPPADVARAESPRRSRRRPVVRWAAVGVCLAIFGAWFISLEPDPRAATSGTGIGLQAYAVDDRNVRIEWDRSAPVVRAAHAGTVEISDGRVRYALALNTEQLRNSSLTYGPQSEVVDVRIKLENGLEESAHVVTPPRPRMRQAPKSSPKPVDAQPAVIPAQAAPRERLEPEPVRQKQPLKRFVLATERRPAQAVATLPDPPPAVGSTVRVPLLAVAPKLPAALPVPVRAAPKHTSGRMIWTGSLTRRGVVEFEGASSTVGSLAGGLPGVPVKLAVFPAEFKNDGLVVYVTDASRHNRTEAPGPSTGWNRLNYVWDPERVKEISVLEAPNASNQFARLALRNDRRSCSVIVVDWWTD